MTKTPETIISICGQIGALHEFTVAPEDKISIDVLEGTGGTINRIRDIVKLSHRKRLTKVIFETGPKKIIKN